MRVLLTAFEPFDGSGLNSSLEACRAFKERAGARWEVRFAVLPVRYGEDTRAVAAALRDFPADVVVHTGQASSARRVQVERVAVNVRYPEDAAPFSPRHLPIEPDGPPALFSTWPVDEVAEAIQAAGVPAGVSNHAGIYLCNHVLYRTLSSETERRVGFLHLPCLAAQHPDGFEAETLGRAIEVTIETLARSAGRGPFTTV